MATHHGLTSEHITDIGIDAYVYLYPLVTMDVSRRQMTNYDRVVAMGKGPMNTFTHAESFPAADFKVVVRPNFDTLYSSAWLDLTKGPIVVCAGKDADGRYYELPMYDMWTDAFAIPGQRTTGTDPGAWVVVPPGFTGEIPAGLERIDAPTPYVWIIGRTQTNGPADYDYVHSVQANYTLSDLATWPNIGATPVVDVDPTLDVETKPLEFVNAMSAETFFDRAMALLALHPPHATDWSLVAQMRRIGLVPGGTFAGLDPAVRSALSDVPAAALASLVAAIPGLARVVNGWQMNLDTMGVYGNFYVKRAIVTMVGLGANPAEDAVYPLLMHDAEGNALDGSNDYVIHFDADKLPPVNAFWSVTMYDAQGFQAANELNRFAIGDRDPLVFNPDGSLDLYLQHRSPGADRESNWLPSPEGPIGVTMRLYSPKPQVLHGTWSPPPVTKR